jgi:molecular chaperone Hsp33
MFQGLPVRGVLVRLDQAWVEILSRRRQSAHGAFPAAVQTVLGDMLAAAVLMKSNITFEGALVMQVMGQGPVKLAVAEVQSRGQVRATASLCVREATELAPAASLADCLGSKGSARCVITLDPKDRRHGQSPYQGVVPLSDDQGGAMTSVAQALEFYMRQSEQLETTLILANNAQLAAGLLIQRLPVSGQANLAGCALAETLEAEHEAGMFEHYQRLSVLARSLTPLELLTLDKDAILRRLFWDEPLQLLRPVVGQAAPVFGCTCSRERVAHMIQGLGLAEAQDILAEQGAIQVGCEFCGAGYRFDAVDTSQLFTALGAQPPSSPAVQ